MKFCMAGVLLTVAASVAVGASVHRITLHAVGVRTAI